MHHQHTTPTPSRNEQERGGTSPFSQLRIISGGICKVGALGASDTPLGGIPEHRMDAVQRARLEGRAVAFNCPFCNQIAGKPCINSSGRTLPFTHAVRRQLVTLRYLAPVSLKSRSAPSLQQLARAFQARVEPVVRRKRFENVVLDLAKKYARRASELTQLGPVTATL